MRKVVVCTNLSLDGVMQSPARPDEDPRNGFQHGGWAAPYAAMAHAGHVFASADALLFGRRTYEDFYQVWPKRPDSPFTPWLNAVQKYVVSRTLREPLPWVNSSLLGEAAAGIRALKQQRIIQKPKPRPVRDTTHPSRLPPNGRCSCQALFGCGYAAMVVTCLHLNYGVRRT